MTEPAADPVAPAPTRPWARGVMARWWAWTADYAYVAYWQVRGALRPGDPGRFASGAGTPVVLIPGIYETWTFLDPLARALHAAGHRVVVVPALGYNRQDLDASARIVAARLADLGLRRVVVVAHSKGGLIAKRLMTTSGPGGVVAGLVAINTPFGGSSYATWFPARRVRYLAPRSADLLALAAEVASHPRIVSVYASFDPHVPGGSELVGAVNVRVDVMGHFRVVGARVVQQAVLEHVRRLGELPPPALPLPPPALPPPAESGTVPPR